MPLYYALYQPTPYRRTCRHCICPNSPTKASHNEPAAYPFFFFFFRLICFFFSLLLSLLLRNSSELSHFLRIARARPHFFVFLIFAPQFLGFFDVLLPPLCASSTAFYRAFAHKNREKARKTDKNRAFKRFCDMSKF